MTSQSPSEILGSEQTHDLEKELKKCNTSNPLVLQFFPGNAEGSSHLGVTKIKDDFDYSKSCLPLAVNLLPGANKQMKTVMADAHPVELKEVELLQSNNMNESVKAFSLVSDPKCGFLLNSTCTTQPVSIENFSTKEKLIVAAGNVEACSKETKDDMSKGSIRGSFPVKYHSPAPSCSSSSAQTGLVTNLVETHKGVSKSLIDSPKLDVQTMVNEMLILSVLLVQSCEHTFDSYKQHDHDKIHIITNLNEFSALYSGQMISAVRSTQTGSPDLLGRSLELSKHSRKGIEEASVETFAIPKKLYNQIAERGQYSVTSSGDVGPERK